MFLYTVYSLWILNQGNQLLLNAPEVNQTTSLNKQHDKDATLTLPVLFLLIQNQQFNYTWMKNIQQQNLCIGSQNSGSGFALLPCDNTKHELRWFYKTSHSTLVSSPFCCHSDMIDMLRTLGINCTSCFVIPKTEHLISEFVPNMCLEAEPQDDSVRLRPCQPSSVFQKWEFTHYYVK